jgi:hypothetical protein
MYECRLGGAHNLLGNMRDLVGINFSKYFKAHIYQTYESIRVICAASLHFGSNIMLLHVVLN